MIETVAQIGSTNAALLDRLAAGESAPEGDWLVADRQVAGRGRAGRVWSDGFGNFMGSTVAHLRSGDPLPQTLALVAGLAVHRAVMALAPGLEGLVLKWPNDLLAGQAKLAGILLERQGDSIVVGIGVNLAQAPDLPDRATASLESLGFRVSRDAFAEALAQEWHWALTRWHCGEWSALRQEWLARAMPVGSLISVNDREHGLLMGAFGGIDGDGVALLRLADGATRAIHAGDIDLVG
ncbi:biotin--[acetyl-CoA-carboxylase] ligase [Novosphingobium huizhouense]|uniref:biotin--[acetyl-CoA-carboxylase] ligase n=1 Tax=Novosphingobium huizhouense TaxID=2866625 RepID=UPI001CD90678|nr:biotin--[acetyl-CoA-carboxylase] ligase [Novosphingobium huizhouense]